jgi:transposase
MEKRRKFSAEFKREAVQMTTLPEATIRQVAKDLGINERLLGRWRRDLMQHGGKAFVGQGHARDEELMRLRRELAKVKQERDFLAEAAAFFARQPK